MNGRPVAKISLLFGVLVGLGSCLWAAVATAASPAAPSDWQRRNTLVEFHDLPKRYSCNELWHKFHDVLLRLGADTHMDILAYRCEKALGSHARSPRVRLEYYVPAIREGGAARTASLTARPEEIRIAPGEPSSIDQHDCALLRQMRLGLPGEVVRFRLNCLAPTQGKPPFSIVYRALVTSGNPSTTAQAGR